MAQPAPIVALDTQQLLRRMGKADVVAFEELHIDDRYQPKQRRRQSRVRPMAENWNPLIAGAAIVSLRSDGLYWLIDGCTRRDAGLLHNDLARREHPEWPVIPGIYAVIHSGLSLAEEAQAATELNGWRLDWHIVDLYGAFLVCEHPTALAIQAALDQHSLKVSYNYGAATISAVQVLEHLHLWGVLPQTLKLIAEAWPENPVAHSKHVLLGVGAFHLRYQEHRYSKADMTAILAQLDPAQILVDAVDVVDPDTYSGRSKWAAVAAYFRDEYNAVASPLQPLPQFQQPPLPRAGQLLSKPPRA